MGDDFLALIKNKYLLGLSLLLLLNLSLNTFAQKVKKCASTKVITKEKLKQFEDWVSQTKSHQDNIRANARRNETLNIPIVFHIIHSGEPVGQGVNISDEQILSQIESTNLDLSKNNNWKDTITQFKSVVGTSKIKLVLAKQDPWGQYTTGIIRINGRKKIWNDTEVPIFKQLSQWPSKDYLNIWVVALGNDFTAIADFPHHKINGLSDALVVGGSNNLVEAGISLSYKACGTNLPQGNNFDLDLNFDTGKTLTHELGHYLGLLHIWGESGCDDSDYISDTPSSDKANYSCNNLMKNTCGTC